MFAWRTFPSRDEPLSGPATTAGPGAFLTVPSLRQAGIGIAFTSRAGGYSAEPFASLDLSLVCEDNPELVARNRGRVLAALGVTLDAWCSARQVHGSRVQQVGTADRGRGALDPATTIEDTDALWTADRGVALAVLTADCVPVVVADPTARRIGVIHAGWRGLVKGVINETVAQMGNPGALVAAIGPAIGPCCYEVGPEVADAARAALGEGVVRAAEGPGTNDRSHLDLWRGAREALRRAGVRTSSIAGLCTRCEPNRFFSHRAGHVARQGVVAVIA